MKLNTIGSIGCKFLVGNGRSIKFWSDIRFQECPLSSFFPQLYNIFQSKNITVFDAILSKGQDLTFSRQLSGVLLIEFNELCTIISSCQLSLAHDQIVWRWSSSGSFTSQSAYEWLSFI